MVEEPRLFFSPYAYGVKYFPFNNSKLTDAVPLVAVLECNLIVFHPYRTLLSICKKESLSDLQTEAGGVAVAVDDGSRYWGNGDEQLELPDDAFQLAPPRTLPSPSEDEAQILMSSLRDVEVVELASKLYHTLDSLSAPRFAHRRLHLHCIAFLVTTVKRRRDQDQGTYFTYEVQADGVHDVMITTEDRLMPFSRARPPTWQTLLLVRPWDRCLLDLPDFTDDLQSMGDRTPSRSPVEHELVESDFNSRALRLIARLGQPFTAFLLARQRDGEYKRIASDHDIIAQVKDISSIHDMMDVRALEIL